MVSIMTKAFKQRFDDYMACGPIINWHEHVWATPEGDLDEYLLNDLMLYADILGYSKIVLSMPVIKGHCDTAQMRKHNDNVYNAIQKYPGRLYGLCYLDPGLTVDAPKELKRCLDDLGFVGIKLYNQYTLDNPVQDELIKQCTKRSKPILMHAGKLNMFADGQPFASHGTHFANAARKHPDATFILAHIGGGGDWNWQVKSIAPFDNILTDMSGSIHDTGMVEYAVRMLGAERVLFGTDGSHASCVGKMCYAKLTRDDKETVLKGTRLASLLI